MSWEKQLFKDSVLSIAQGEVNGHSGVHKFGAVPAMSQNNTGTVWDVNDTTYPWSSWDTAGTVSIPTVNASDNGKTVTLVGLDANYEDQTEEVVVSSSGAVTTTNTWKRLYRAYISTGEDNVGNITVQKGGTTVLQITAGKGQTLMAIYTVPANHTAYLICGVCSVQDGADATGDMFVRYDGQSVFRIGHSFEVAGKGGPYSHKFAVPIRLPEKTDIDVRATVRSNNARVTAAFDMILVQDGYEHV
jgi:hypothetical protein